MRARLAAALVTVLAVSGVGLTSAAGTTTVPGSASPPSSAAPAAEEAGVQPLNEPSPSTGIPVTTRNLPSGVVRHDPAAIKPDVTTVYAEPAVRSRAILRAQARDENRPRVRERGSREVADAIESRRGELQEAGDRRVDSVVTYAVRDALEQRGLRFGIRTEHDVATTQVTVADAATAEQVSEAVAGLPVRVRINPTQEAVREVFETVRATLGTPVTDVGGRQILPEDVAIVEDRPEVGIVITTWQGDHIFTERQWAMLTQLGARYPGVLEVHGEDSLGRPQACVGEASDGRVLTRCDTPALPGSFIRSADGAECTAGFRMTGDSGQQYVVTAGHCPALGPWSGNPMTGEGWQVEGSDWDGGLTDSPRFLGYSYKNYLSYHSQNDETDGYWDQQIINVDPGRVSLDVAQRTPGATTTTAVAVQGLQKDDPAVGDLVCYHGAVTGRNCGQVTSTDVSFPVFNDEIPHIGDPDGLGAEGGFIGIRVVSTDIATSVDGDSGAPVLPTYVPHLATGTLTGVIGSGDNRRMVFTKLQNPAMEYLSIYPSSGSTVTLPSSTSTRYQVKKTTSSTSATLGTVTWVAHPGIAVTQTRLEDGRFRWAVTYNYTSTTTASANKAITTVRVGCLDRNASGDAWREIDKHEHTVVGTNAITTTANVTREAVIFKPCERVAVVRFDTTYTATDGVQVTRSPTSIYGWNRQFVEPAGL